MKQAKRKLTNKIKLIIVVSIILLLLVILFANRNKILKLNQMAGVGYNVTINQITIDISNVITSTPNVPVLGAGMIPIKWNENAGVWEITTPNDSNWYDYSSGKYANIMLSDGKYASELTRGKETAIVGAQVQETDLGSIFTWVPRLMYKESNIEFLKNTCMVEYDWITPSCFTYAKQGLNELDLAFTGMWVSKQTDTLSTMSTKTNQMNIEDNVYGLIKNEKISVITNEGKTVIEKLNLKCGDIKNETRLTNLQSGEYKQVIKILNTNMYAKMTTQHDISAGTIIFKTIYKENDIRCVVDEDGNILNATTSGNATYDIDIDKEQYIFYVIDNEGNIKKHALMYVPVGKPDLTGFDKNSTFYVTYDANGNETSVIPIGEEVPTNWYDYDNQIWANIVVRNNEKEAYFVWIPRYEYMLDSTNERSRVILIPKSKTTADSGYQISEAFIWNGTQISGYWMSKYQLGT